MFLDRRGNTELERLTGGSPGRYAGWDTTGVHRRDDDAIGRHLTRVLSAPELDPSRIRKRKFRVVVDCVNAAGGAVLPRMLRELECDVIEMNCELSGVFSHPPEPLPENLAALGKAVKNQGADLGIAVDPDVDRLVLFDEKGEPFGEENTVTTAINFVLSKQPPDSAAVVVNLSTTRAVDDIARRYGAKVYRTPVGEINVAARMKDVGAVIGGEGSGGVIFPAVHYMRDAVAGTAILLQQLSESGNSLSEFRDSLPRYVIRKTTLRDVAPEHEAVMERLVEKYSSGARCNREDGLKFDFKESWVSLRKSNTEPIIRVIAEAPTARQADSLIDEIKKEFH
jgi:phosphomannomutase